MIERTSLRITIALNIHFVCVDVSRDGSQVVNDTYRYSEMSN